MFIGLFQGEMVPSKKGISSYRVMSGLVFIGSIPGEVGPSTKRERVLIRYKAI